MTDRLHVYRGENLAVCGAEVPDICPECAAPPSVAGDAGLRAALETIRNMSGGAIRAFAEAALAAKPAEGLDVERLARAIQHVEIPIGAMYPLTQPFIDRAEAIAAEYARLRSETPEAGT